MTSEEITNLYPVYDPDVAGRVFDGEAVVVLPARGQVLVLNGVGSRVWELVDGKRSVGDVVGAIVAEYETSEEQAREDVLAFLKVLEVRGALKLEER